MNISTATKLENQTDDDRQQLESALNNWHECVLRFLRDQLSEVNADIRAAEDGLGIAHRNQGQVAEDLILYLWDKLNDKSDLFFRLVRAGDRIQEMELPELITLFSHTTKLKNYPWEGDAWQLPSSILEDRRSKPS